jgi:4-aminobutyrate aminotransferase-like enzyme
MLVVKTRFVHCGAIKSGQEYVMLTKQQIQQFRAKHFSSSLKTSYEEPILMVRGEMQYMYDEDGNKYLDAYNNVAHVGHCHPHVVKAAQEQLARLNTNTRYLHPNLILYAQKLLATFPSKLNACFFVNSGSEANDLALRLARTYSGGDGVVVLENAYHGTTVATSGISPTKSVGPGGSPLPQNVRVAVVPDTYRGKYGRECPNAGELYALDVKKQIESLEKDNHHIAAFFCESIQGVGGQIVFPEGYLQTAYEFVRNSGGLCVADEVQVGFGRVGTHFWGFETQEVVPDIVTLGKSIGNGFPLGCVVTTKEIAESFAQLEYFNTFGGNTVACAVGVAVLEVIENENLQF